MNVHIRLERRHMLDSYLLVCDVLGAYEAVYHSRVKLPASRNLKHKWRQLYF